MGQKVALIEALLFAARQPVDLQALVEASQLTELEVQSYLLTLASDYRNRGAGVELVSVAGGYQLRTRKAFAPYVETLLSPEPYRLSRAALEVLAVVASKQPVTRTDIEAIRGVSSDSSLRTLLECGLVDELGRKDAPGRPFLYGTTPKFLEEFGLESLDQLKSQLQLPPSTDSSE